MGAHAPRFLCDEHIPVPFCRALERAGIDGIHVLDIGMKGAVDHVVLQRARRDGRILITRNYRDFVALAETWSRQGVTFPGVLFVSASIPQGDVAAHLRALNAWTESRHHLEGSCGWLT